MLGPWDDGYVKPTVRVPTGSPKNSPRRARAILRFAVLIIVCGWASFLQADISTPSEQLLTAGVQHLHDMDYAGATAAFDKHIARFPEDPKGYFFKAQIAYWQFYISDSEEDGVLFKNLSDTSVKAAKKRLKKNPEDLEAQLYLGRSYGNLGRYYGMRGSYIKAFWKSKKGKNALKPLVDRKTGFDDALFELGLYHYYADLAPRLFKTLSFVFGVEGDRELGLSQLETASQRGTFTQSDAMYFLQSINFHVEEDFPEVERLTKELVKRHPTNMQYQMRLGRALRANKHPQQAIAAYEVVTKQGGDSPFPDLALTAEYEIAATLLLMNELEKAAASFRAIVARRQSADKQDHWTYNWSLYQLGTCLELGGKRQQATDTYQLISKKSNDGAYRSAQQRIETPLEPIDIVVITAHNLTDAAQYDEAIALLTATLERTDVDGSGFDNSAKPQIEYQIGRTKQEMHDFQGAIPHLNAVLTASEEVESWMQAWAHYRLACCYQALDKDNLAERHFDQAAELGDKKLRLRVERERSP